MKIIKKKQKPGRKIRRDRDPRKESLFRELSSLLRDAGVAVRREELKRGPGWQAMSGLCRLDTDPVVFVDQRLTQDEQIAFLVEHITALEIAPSPEQLKDLPGPIVNQIRRTSDLPGDSSSV